VAVRSVTAGLGGFGALIALEQFVGSGEKQVLRCAQDDKF